MKFDEPAQRPATEWTRFVEILRAFCLSDEEQGVYFPVLKEPYFYSSIASDDITLCSYSPALANGYNLSVYFYGICEAKDEEMFTQLAELFFELFEIICDSKGSFISPKPTADDTEGLDAMRPRLRALCSEALEFFGAEKRAPAMKWEEIAPR